MPEEKIVVTTQNLERALNRIANIAFGFSWKHKATYELAFTSANVAVVTHCYYLKVPYTTDIDSIIKKALVRNMSIYYTKNGRLREYPLGDQEVDFTEPIIKLA